MYIWTSWFAHFLRQTKLEEDYPPREREREREWESIWNWSFRYKSEAFSITKGQRVFSFFLLLRRRNTSFLLHYEHLGNLFYWNGNWTTSKSCCGANEFMTCCNGLWLDFKTLLLWMEKKRMRSSVQKPWTLILQRHHSPSHTVQCHITSIWLASGKYLQKANKKWFETHLNFIGDGFFDSFLI
jgi:hypothetical protein